jgi:transposase InsO family protein
LRKKNSKDRRTPTILNINAASASAQAGLWLITRSLHKVFPESVPVEEVCRRLGIGRSVAYEAAERISRRLQAPGRVATRARDEHAACKQALCERDFEIEMLRYQLDHPSSREAGARIQFEPTYKAFVEDRRAHYGVTIERASQILKIPVDTMKKFPRFVNEAAAAATPASDEQELPPIVIELVNEYLRSGRGTKSVKTFCERHPELLARLEMNYRQVLSWLKRLGFVSPRGIFLKNKGLDKILRFKPNQVWGSDGKRMCITINGEIFEWVWQCLVDGKTTVIVGGLISPEENTENLLTAIKESKCRTGVTPLAIVLDNRLSENLPAVRVYLDEMGIEIIKIFPGNSKSNGIVEGNFNIFDRWVGVVEINGETPEALSRSIAASFVEVFTQMRNHKPRASLSGKSAQEAANEAVPASPEEEAQVRAKLKELADRLKNEQTRPIVSEQKKAAIQQAIAKTTPPQPDVFENKLQNARFTPDLLLQGLAVFDKCRREQPEKSFGHTYYGGIVRNLADQQSVEFLNTSLEATYTLHWETMGRITESEHAQSLKSNPEATCTRLASDYVNMPVPTYAVSILLDLKKSFLVASKGSAIIATKAL